MKWQMADGNTIRYVKVGNGPLVVMLHGLGGLAEIFSAQQQALSVAGFCSVAIDMPGHGGSTPNDMQELDFVTLASQVTRFCQEFTDGKPFYVIGHSLGAAVSYYLLCHTDMHIKKVIAIDQSPKMLNDETWHFGFKDWTKQNLSAKMYAPNLGKATVKPLDDHVWSVYHPAKEVYNHFDLAEAKLLLKTHAQNDWRIALSEQQTPLLIALGKNSPYFDNGFGIWLAQKNRLITTSTIVDSGHLPMAEQPAEFNNAMLKFFAD